MKKNAYLFPMSVCGSASVEVLASTSCAEVVNIFTEPRIVRRLIVGTPFDEHGSC